MNGSSVPPAIVSISYGGCEALLGAAQDGAFNAAYEQAVTEGASVFVSAGDNGPGGCTASYYWSVFGIGVSGFSSTPYNVSVGGTDFGDTYAGTNSTYWSSTNNSVYGSALSYVPEIPWNDSCASSLLASIYGYSVTYGDQGFCDGSSTGALYWDNTAASGGPSACASGQQAEPGVVSGTCAGWPKPTWQSLVGVPNDGFRDIPDVSLFAANGLWSHYYPVCYTDSLWGGVPCTGTPDTWSGAGGTSFASPIMAGIQALVNQKTGDRRAIPTRSITAWPPRSTEPVETALAIRHSGIRLQALVLPGRNTRGDNNIDCQTYDCYWPNATESTPSDPTVGVLSTTSVVMNQLRRTAAAGPTSPRSAGTSPLVSVRSTPPIW